VFPVEVTLIREATRTTPQHISSAQPDGAGSPWPDQSPKTEQDGGDEEQGGRLLWEEEGCTRKRLKRVSLRRSTSSTESSH
jgi:hypothetical protein